MLADMITTFSEIIDLWPSAESLGGDIGVGGGTVRKWKSRNSIPGSFWLPIITAAAKRGIEGLTLDLLAALAAKQDAA